MNRDLDPESSNEDEDNWLMSYADLLTNLLAFFVMLFAVSNVTTTRWEMMADAFQGKKHTGVGEAKEKIDRFIADHKLAGSLDTTLDEHGLAVRFGTKLLFESGRAELAPQADEVLQPLVGALKSLEHRYDIAVEGHADDVPIHTPEFDSNWELSAKRSVNVVKRLIEAGLPRAQLSAQAFAETRPEKEDSRAQNRRVVVRVR